MDLDQYFSVVYHNVNPCYYSCGSVCLNVQELVFMSIVCRVNFISQKYVYPLITSSIMSPNCKLLINSHGRFHQFVMIKRQRPNRTTITEHTHKYTGCLGLHVSLCISTFVYSPGNYSVHWLVISYFSKCAWGFISYNLQTSGPR